MGLTSGTVFCDDKVLITANFSLSFHSSMTVLFPFVQLGAHPSIANHTVKACLKVFLRAPHSKSVLTCQASFLHLELLVTQKNTGLTASPPS